MDAGGPISFTGYDEVVTESTVRGILLDGVVVPSAAEGAEVEIVLDRTPFYAEGGGQLADQGLIQLSDGGLVEVLDVQSPMPGIVVHRARVSRRRGHGRGGRRSGRSTSTAAGRSAAPTPPPTSCTRRSATHSARPRPRPARRTRRAGSGSTSRRPSAVPPSVLTDVEHQVNEVLAADLAVHAEVMTQEQARAAGAMALFGEKYGDRVRVVSVGDWARELCGGTHARRSGQLGLVKILGEASIGAGVRRVEALVGVDAYQFLAREHLLVAQLTEALKVPREELPDRVAALTARLREAEKDLERLRVRPGAGGGGEPGREPDRRLRRGRRGPPGARRHRGRRPAAAGPGRPRPHRRPTARRSWPASRSPASGRWSSWR